MPLDALVVSRPEVGIPLALQVIFASVAVGLGSYVLVLEGLWIATRTGAFRELRGLWTKGFVGALALALGAAAASAAGGALFTAWRAAARGFPYRPVQLVISAFLATTLVVGAASAWRLLREPEDAGSCVALRMAIGMYVICGPLEAVMGDGRSARSHLILALGALVALLGLWGGVLCWRSAPERSRAFLIACLVMGPLGLLAPVAEWLGAEAALIL